MEYCIRLSPVDPLILRLLNFESERKEGIQRRGRNLLASRRASEVVEQSSIGPRTLRLLRLSPSLTLVNRGGPSLLSSYYFIQTEGC